MAAHNTAVLPRTGVFVLAYNIKYSSQPGLVKEVAAVGHGMVTRVVLSWSREWFYLQDPHQSPAQYDLPELKIPAFFQSGSSRLLIFIIQNSRNCCPQNERHHQSRQMRANSTSPINAVGTAFAPSSTSPTRPLPPRTSLGSVRAKLYVLDIPRHLVHPQ